MLKSLSNKYLVQTGTQKEKKNRDTETKKIFEVFSELLDWIGSFGHHINGFAHVQISYSLWSQRSRHGPIGAENAQR